MIVVVRSDDGAEVDITEGVKCLYDMVIGSMDWGSGFWTVEDALPVAEVARACGFPNVDEVDAYLAARARDEQTRKEWRENAEKNAAAREAELHAKGLAAHDPAKWNLAFTGAVTNDHGHAFELDGVKCVWPGCTLVRTPK